MKILLVTQFYYPERFSTTDIAEGLVKQGHEVTVLTGKPNYGYGHILHEYKHVKYEELNGVKIHRVKLYPRKNSRMSIIRNYLSFHRNSKKYVKHLDRDFDVVLSICLSPIISAAAACKYAKKYNIPHIHYCEDLWPESVLMTNAVKKTSLMYKLLYKWSVSIYRDSDDIFISSPSFKEYFVNELRITNKSFTYINQPIIKSNNSDVTAVQYTHQHNFVYAGNISKPQMIDELIDGMKAVKNVDAKLYLLGMGQLTKHIQKRIKEEKIEHLVEFVGPLPIEKAEAYFTNADALIVSLRNGGYVGKTIPNKSIQYMKYGKPILGVISGDGKELLEKAKGAVFASENPAEIAQTIENICNMPREKLTQFGKNNKEYFDSNLTSEKICYLFSEAIKESIK